MSHPFPSHTSTLPARWESSITPSLLTPPLTPRNEHDVPYRPTNTDRTSLNLRKSKHKAKAKPKSQRQPETHRQGQLMVNRGNFDLQNEASLVLLQDDLPRSRSLSKLQGLVSGEVSPRNNPQKPRRWTLPSKSPATRVLTPLRSTIRQSTVKGESESPAMITLRRATTNRAPQRVELTFFPEPSFGKQKSNLLSYLVSTLARSTTVKDMCQVGDHQRAAREVTRSASMGSDGAYPVLTIPAAAVCTEASVESTFTGLGEFLSKSQPRRCSTKYVTIDSSFEVIWDENDGSTTTQESSRPSVGSERRSSIAIQKLEAQLARSPEDNALVLRRSTTASGKNSPNSSDVLFEQALTPEKLTHLFSSLTHASSLRDLPRSKSGVNQSRTVYSTASETSNCQVMKNHSPHLSTQDSDYLPPLRSRGISATNDRHYSTDCDDQQTRRRQSATTSATLFQPRSRFGSMVGSSSHTRRRSSVSVGTARRRSFVPKHLTRKADMVFTETETDDAEEMPLLSTNWLYPTSRGKMNYEDT